MLAHPQYLDTHCWKMVQNLSLQHFIDAVITFVRQRKESCLMKVITESLKRCNKRFRTILSSACLNIKLVYHNHCYYDPQVAQWWYLVDQISAKQDLRKCALLVAQHYVTMHTCRLSVQTVYIAEVLTLLSMGKACFKSKLRAKEDLIDLRNERVGSKFSALQWTP